MANAFFDLHFHPLFKSFISYHEDKFPSQRKAADLVKSFRLNSKLANKIDDIILHMLQSQCSMDQCMQGGVRIGVASVANLEFGFADSKGFVSDIIKSEFTAPMDKKYFDKVKKGEVSYYRLLIKELDLYKQLAAQLNDPEKEKNLSDYRIGFLSRKDKMQAEELMNGKSMCLVFSLEGGHNLSRFKIGQTLEIDKDLHRLGDDTVDKMNTHNHPVSSLQDFHQDLWHSGMDLMYLTLTHLSHISEQFLATHAFGMKMLKHASFFPTGNGISALGKEVVEACYHMTKKTERKVKGKVVTEEVATPVLIDVKHMGLKSRQDLYELRREMKKNNPANILPPILASHVGVTGYSIIEWKNALKRQKCKVYNFEGVRCVEVQNDRKKCGEWGSGLNNEFTFNPWSINMMDDDIVEVLDSRGLIGVSLDVRLLGFQAKIGLNTGDQSEYLSTADFQTHFPYIGLLTLPGDKLESMAIAAESWLVPTKEERHPLCLCFNIIHIVTVGLLRSEVENPWEYICIGSDFDGMIDPLKTCSDASSLGELEYNLKKWLPVAADSYRKENGGPDIFDVKDKKGNKVSFNNLVSGILYENGKKFIVKWLQNDFDH
ncbi:MAG TPA: hypothetical protein VL098_12235 [Flavipsychrobacter sp.]|nr:hypothetical protein [Flavipsychrobacter sp.]